MGRLIFCTRVITSSAGNRSFQSVLNNLKILFPLLKSLNVKSSHPNSSER